MLKKLTPNLIVKDVNATVKWYQDILGCFEVTLTDPDKGKLEWALMSCEDVDIMFQSKDSIVKSLGELADNRNGGNSVIFLIFPVVCKITGPFPIDKLRAALI